MNETLNQDQQRLVVENMEFAEHMARRFGGTIAHDQNEKSVTMDDLRQEAMMGLCEAAMRFDPELGVAFTTLAYIWCRKLVLKALRKYSVPLSVCDNYDGEEPTTLHFDYVADDIISTDDADEGTLADRLLYRLAEEAEREQVAAEVRRKRLLRAYSGLTRGERRAIACIYDLNPLTKQDVKRAATKLGVGYERLCEVRERLLCKMEQSLSA